VQRRMAGAPSGSPDRAGSHEKEFYALQLRATRVPATHPDIPPHAKNGRQNPPFMCKE